MQEPSDLVRRTAPRATGKCHRGGWDNGPMKLNAFTDVCLRVLMTLGQDAGTKLTTQQIADRIAVPYNHVVKAVGELRRRGLVDVARGRTGGAVITEAGLDQRIGRLVHELNTRPEMVDCTGLESGVPCPLRDGCGLRLALARARDAFYAELDQYRVRDLTAHNETFLGLPAVGRPAPGSPADRPDAIPA